MPLANTSTQQELCHLFPAMCGGATVPTGTISTVPTQPKILTNAGGVQISTGQTTFDKILSTFLSSVALFKNASYVPTTVQPVNQYPSSAYDYQQQALLQQQLYAQQSTGANIENFIRNNTGLLLVVGLGFVLLMTKPPRR